MLLDTVAIGHNPYMLLDPWLGVSTSHRGIIKPTASTPGIPVECLKHSILSILAFIANAQHICAAARATALGSL